MKNGLTLILVSFFSLLVSFAYAQKPVKKPVPPTASKTAVSPEAAALKLQFNEFIEAYAGIEKNKDASKVLKHVSPDVISTLVSFDLTGKMNILYSDYKGFAGYLDKLMTTENLAVNYNLDNIDKIYISGNIAVVVYGVAYENKRGGEIWSKGYENVSLTYKKIAGEWKIVQYIVTQIEDEKTKVSCICELTVENGGQDFVMKTTIPSGRSYVTELNPIGFMFPNDAKMIVIGEKYYKWLPSGDINYMEEPVGESTKITETKIATVTDQNDRQKAVEIILTQHYYKTICNEVQVKAKGK
jgi:ketosteroid isomerase-like protein